MRKFLASAAALAMAATMAHADPGKGHGGGGGNPGGGHGAAHAAGHGPQSHGNGGGGGQASMHGAPAARGPAGGSHGPSFHQAKARTIAERGPDKHASAPIRGPSGHGSAKPAKGQPNIRPAQREAARALAKGDRGDRAELRQRANDVFHGDRRVRRVERVANFEPQVNRGLIDGCPPGLAKKNNGCTPPGLLRDQVQRDYRYRQAYYQPDWWGYRSLGDRAYYDNGYLYRLSSNNSILGYVPLLGGALSVGQTWPSYYQPAPVPSYYTDYYNLGPENAYRYADDVLYRVDPQTSAITSIAALLTGDQFNIGQPMPMGYDVYNVPYSYRDRYYDTPDANYRYADGYIYQVDPKTQLIAAAIQLLT